MSTDGEAGHITFVPQCCLQLSAAHPSSSLGAPMSCEDHQRPPKGAQQRSVQMLALLGSHCISISNSKLITKVPEEIGLLTHLNAEVEKAEIFSYVA